MRSSATSRLPDGTLYYGRLGEIACDADEDQVQCHLCGGWFRRVGGSHLLRGHGWTLAEYRDAFRLPLLAPTSARGLSTTLKIRAESRLGRDGFAMEGPARRGARQDRIRPWQSLAARAPELVLELHPTRNKGLDPAKVAWAANRRLWWRCPRCGNEWQAMISSRTFNGSGCPECARRTGTAAMGATKRQAPRSQSLTALRPDLLALWHPIRNGDLDPSTMASRSSQRVWWACPACGRAWQSSVNNRSHSKHAVCPTCARRIGALASHQQQTGSRAPSGPAGDPSDAHPSRG
jgi:hypothetical protein